MTRLSATSPFVIDEWQEADLISDDSLRVHSTKATKRYEGDFEGTSEAHLLMAYVNGEPTAYCGFERMVGTLGGRDGSFVLHHDAGHGIEGGLRLEVVPGSGSDGLEGIEGSARIEITTGENAGQHTMYFDYSLD